MLCRIHLAVNLRLNWELYMLWRIHLAVNLRLNWELYMLWRIHLAVNLRLNRELSILWRIHLAVNLRLNCKFVIYWVGLLRNCFCICRMRLLRNSQLSLLSKLRSVCGPYQCNPFNTDCVISPLQCVPKRDSTEPRIVHDLSFRQFQHFLNRCWVPTWTSV